MPGLRRATDRTLSMTSPTDTTPAAPKNVRLIIASTAVLLLLAALDQTIVSTALPTIVADLGGLEHLSWVVTAYILSSTVVAPLYGKLGDLYGRRVMIFVSVGLFLAGSALCGIAQSMTFLIVSRALQGLGGGGLFVLALSVVGDVIAPRDRGKIQGVFAAVFSLSSVLGPVLGGWFVEAFTWHWIFYINIPLGLLAVASFAYSFPKMGPQAQHQIDWAGAAALTVALASLTLVTSLGGSSFAWMSAPAIGLAALFLAGTVAFILVEGRAAEPILPLSLFRENVFVTTGAVNFISGAALFGAVTFLPLYLQIARGVSPTLSGLMLVPMTLGIVAAAQASGLYMGRTARYKLLPMLGTGLITLGALQLTMIDRTSSLVLFSVAIATLGLGLGCIFPVVTTAVQNAVPRAQLGSATAAGVMFRQIGGSLAVAVFGTLFALRMAAGLGAQSIDLGAEIGPQSVARLPAEQQQAVALVIADAIHPIYWIVAALGLAGFLVARLLKEIPLNSHAPQATAAAE